MFIVDPEAICYEMWSCLEEPIIQKPYIIDRTQGHRLLEVVQSKLRSRQDFLSLDRATLYTFTHSSKDDY